MHHRRVRRVGHLLRVETALLHRPAIAVITVLLHLGRRLPIGGIRHHVIAIALRRGRRRWHLRRWLHHHVLLGAAFVGVIRTGREEEQRAAHPHFARIVRQVMHADAIRWRHHHITRALRAIPIAAGVEIILTTVRHTVVAIREAVDYIAWAMLRARPPAIAVTVGATWPAVVAGARAGAAGFPMRVAVITARDVAVVALTRFLGLAHGVGATLDRQVVRRLRLRLRLRSPLLVTLRAPLPLATTVLATTIKMLILRAWLIVFRPRLIVLRARRLIPTPGSPALRPSFMLAAAFTTRPVVTFVGHCLGANGDHQQTYTCHTPDALHAIPHCGLGPVHETGKARPGSRTGYQQAKEKG
ncbi:hypothetical protein ALQ17_05356 [Pseudomonas fluorescens]|nr:hypothetical protein ALQ17_05356 [Pseudomonas fluorescens]